MVRTSELSLSSVACCAVCSMRTSSARVVDRVRRVNITLCCAMLWSEGHPMWQGCRNDSGQDE